MAALVRRAASGGRGPMTGLRIFYALAHGFMRPFAVCVLLSAACHATGQEPESKRLSTWLAEQRFSPGAYFFGLSWRVPAEVPYQTELKMRLLSSLREPGRAEPDAARRLADWIEALPVTGRVPVAVGDGRWLEVNPTKDPVLRPGHAVVVPERPTTVTVITETGGHCRVPHHPGREARAYVIACDPRRESQIDWVWVAQADGRVQRYGVALWNEQEQDEPSPGAWIWAPSRSSGWGAIVSERLVAFLATQGPAPDQREAARPGRLPSPSPGGLSVPASLLQPPVDQRELPEIAPTSVPPPGRVRSRDAATSSSNYGNVGLLQTPSARMAETGHFSFNLSRSYPYTYGNVFLQPFDRMEVGFRYINISNRLYGPEVLSGTQAYKDKSIDVKFRLFDESAYLPEMAVGLRDASGTGLFSGEYLVANKRFGPLDVSLGLGWGYLGARGNLRNPLSLVSKTFDSRTNDFGQGGSFSFGSFFRGRTSLFGGIQYQTPWESLLLKVEYDGNDHRADPLGNVLPSRTPWNVGLVYRAAKALDLTLGVERGNTVMLGMTLHSDLDKLWMPKLSDPPRVPVAPFRPRTPPDWAMTGRAIAAQTGWHVASIVQVGRELRVQVEEAQEVYWRERVDRVAAILHRDAPEDIDRFTLTYRQHGLELSSHVVIRDSWVAQQSEALPPHRASPAVFATPVGRVVPGSVLFGNQLPRFESGLGFSWQHTLGGPDGFLLYQAGVAASAKWRIRDDTWIDGRLRLGLMNNYDKFRFTGPSLLPRVRTFLREYLVTSPFTMQYLQATHVGQLTQNQYYSVYGGYLEEMYAGVGAEWLYRPHSSRLALGVDVNAVQQRDFRQDFALRDYSVLTGHATVYWDTGWQGVNVLLAAGRYLAKDIGATLLAFRTFDNGVTAGAFATKTNVSAATFGEGSFDKGVFLQIPFDAFLTRSSGNTASFFWKPLTRDGGAMLARQSPLYGLTHVREDRSLRNKPAPPPDDEVTPSSRKPKWQPQPREPEAFSQVVPKRPPERWLADSVEEGRLVEALYRQNFRDIQVRYDLAQRLTLTLSNEAIHPISRAVGRAALAALRLGPIDMREIRVVFTVRGMPGATYDFADLNRLDRYFRADLARAQLSDYVAVSYADPSLRESDPLARLGDTEAEPEQFRIATALPPVRSAVRVADDVLAAGKQAASTDWWQAGAWGAGLTLASALVDKRALTFARNHANGTWAKRAISGANALPWIGLAGAALVAMDGSDPIRSRTGVAAVEAGVGAFALATGLKYLVGRARPEENLGNTNFKPFSTAAAYDSFPSRHTITAWAVATPFALEYDAPWLYGVAALTNLSRIGGRDHWVSDTVASSALGYALGRLFWESGRAPKQGEPRVMVNPSGVKLAWEFQ